MTTEPLLSKTRGPLEFKIRRGTSKNRYLVVLRAGDSGLFRHWDLNPAARDWDLLISFYGRDRAALDVEHEYTSIGGLTKWIAAQQILVHEPWLIDRYDAFLFL